jgi:hypothetical protein
MAVGGEDLQVLQLCLRNEEAVSTITQISPRPIT